MKNLNRWSLVFGTLLCCSLSTIVSAQQNQPQPTLNSPSNQSFKIGVVNTKRCLEESKFGKQEQANFEKMKNQMETVLHDKEATLEDLEAKLNDDDYMDSISEEAANELRRKKRNIRNEGMQLQNQYLQTLQQTNLKIVQKLTEAISKASAQVAQDTSSGQSLEAIFTDEACTFYATHLDVTDRIIAKMNAIFDSEQKETPAKPR